MFQRGLAVDYFIAGKATVEDLRRTFPWCMDLSIGDFTGEVQYLPERRGAGISLVAEGQVRLVVWALHYGDYDFVSSQTGEELVGLSIRDPRDLGVKIEPDGDVSFLDNETRFPIPAGTRYKILASGSLFFLQKFANEQP